MFVYISYRYMCIIVNVVILYKLIPGTDCCKKCSEATCNTFCIHHQCGYNSLPFSRDLTFFKYTPNKDYIHVVCSETLPLLRTLTSYLVLSDVIPCVYFVSYRFRTLVMGDHLHQQKKSYSSLTRDGKLDATNPRDS